MELRLTLTGPERLLSGRTAASLREGSLHIGRSADADWMIADPERIISKVHCRIDRSGDGFHVTDLSTNGVRVNDTPVGYGVARQVAHGDVIRLGDATVSVAIAATSSPEPSATAILAEGPFAAFPQESQAGAHAAPAQAEPVATGMVLDDWWQPLDEGPDQPAAKPVDISVQSPSVANVRVQPEEDSLWSHDRSVARLLGMVAGLDMEEFVRAVDAATASLSPGEQVKFRERLSEILRNASGR